MGLFTGIIGDPGSGKSALMTAWLYEAYKNGQPIVANYRLKFSYKTMTFEDMATLPPELHGSVIGADELGVGADAYDTFAAVPRNMTKLVTQLRHRDCLLYYTVQRFNFIAYRLRQLTSRYALMEDLDKAKDHRKEPCDGLFKLETYEAAGMHLINQVTFNARPIWHLYDTHQIIETTKVAEVK